MENKKDIIINELETISKKEALAGNYFKVRAYQKVINQIKRLDIVYSMDDLKNIEGIGSKIKAKIQEILETGKLMAAERARELTTNGISKIQLYDEFLKIHGIGIAKAKELVDVYKLKTIDDLKQLILTNDKILNEQQKIGLKYFYDLEYKIPRNEMKRHLTYINKQIKQIYPKTIVKIVGSYRRGLKESSDIDVIVSSKKNNSEIILDDIISQLKKKDKSGFKYIQADLSKGKQKYMGICQLNKRSKARRIDILLTNPQQYPFALLYFTGDFDINIELRKRANELGYTLNEYGLKPNNSSKPILNLNSEKEIFHFLGYKYLQPKQRMGQNLKNI